jgi:hypothetical protein
MACSIYPRQMRLGGKPPGVTAPGFRDEGLRPGHRQAFHLCEGQGAAIISELQDGFGGGWIYRALDQERHQWEISPRGRDLPAERWQLPPGSRVERSDDEAVQKVKASR